MLNIQGEGCHSVRKPKRIPHKVVTEDLILTNLKKKIKTLLNTGFLNVSIMSLKGI